MDHWRSSALSYTFTSASSSVHTEHVSSCPPQPSVSHFTSLIVVRFRVDLLCVLLCCCLCLCGWIFHHFSGLCLPLPVCLLLHGLTHSVWARKKTVSLTSLWVSVSISDVVGVLRSRFFSERFWWTQFSSCFHLTGSESDCSVTSFDWIWKNKDEKMYNYLICQVFNTYLNDNRSNTYMYK